MWLQDRNKEHFLLFRTGTATSSKWYPGMCTYRYVGYVHFNCWPKLYKLLSNKILVFPRSIVETGCVMSLYHTRCGSLLHPYWLLLKLLSLWLLCVWFVYVNRTSGKVKVFSAFCNSEWLDDSGQMFSMSNILLYGNLQCSAQHSIHNAHNDH